MPILPQYLSHIRSLGGFVPLKWSDDTVSVPVISIGRSASVFTSGAHTNFTIAFAGGAPASGTWVVIAVASTNAITSVTGGSAWTHFVSGAALSGGVGDVYYKRCGASEPTSYTVNVTLLSTDSACCSMSEVLTTNVTNPDASASATATSTCPTATSSAATDCGVLVVVTGDNSGITIGAPSGWTMQTQTNDAGSNFMGTAIATKLNVGSGTISPGNFSNTSNSNSISTILLKL